MTKNLSVIIHNMIINAYKSIRKKLHRRIRYKARREIRLKQEEEKFQEKLRIYQEEEDLIQREKREKMRVKKNKNKSIRKAGSSEEFKVKKEDKLVISDINSSEIINSSCDKIMSSKDHSSPSSNEQRKQITILNEEPNSPLIIKEKVKSELKNNIRKARKKRIKRTKGIVSDFGLPKIPELIEAEEEQV